VPAVLGLVFISSGKQTDPPKMLLQHIYHNIFRTKPLYIPQIPGVAAQALPLRSFLGSSSLGSVIGISFQIYFHRKAAIFLACPQGNLNFFHEPTHRRGHNSKQNVEFLPEGTAKLIAFIPGNASRSPGGN